LKDVLLHSMIQINHAAVVELIALENATIYRQYRTGIQEMNLEKEEYIIS
jgi:hypothetical protein